MANRHFLGATHSRIGAGVFPSFRECLDPRGPFLIPIAIAIVSRIAFWTLVPQAAEDAVTYVH